MVHAQSGSGVDSPQILRGRHHQSRTDEHCLLGVDGEVIDDQADTLSTPCTEDGHRRVSMPSPQIDISSS